MSAYAHTIFDLVAYEVGCSLQALDFLARLSDEECRRDFGFGLRTPHRTMSHIADVMRVWSARVGPEPEPPTWPDYDEGESLAAIRRSVRGRGLRRLVHAPRRAADAHRHAGPLTPPIAGPGRMRARDRKPAIPPMSRFCCTIGR